MTVKRVRKAAEDELSLPQNWFKEHGAWASKSKEIVQDEYVSRAICAAASTVELSLALLLKASFARICYVVAVPGANTKFRIPRNKPIMRHPVRLSSRKQRKSLQASHALHRSPKPHRKQRR